MNTTEIGDTIRQAREKLGKGKAEISRETGIARNTLIAIEAGRSTVLDNLLAYADAVGVTIVAQLRE